MFTDREVIDAIRRMRKVGSDTQAWEVKESVLDLPRSLPETISAFANLHGGMIILGLSERNGFTPAEGFDAEATYSKMQIAGDELTPVVRMEIEKVAFENAFLVVARVPETARHLKPCFITARGRYEGSFVRTGDGDRHLTPYEVDRLLEFGRQPRFDAQAVPESSMEDLHPEILQGILSRVRRLSPRVFGGLSDETVLIQLGAVKRIEGVLRPTLAGLLAAGIFPQRLFPRLEVVFTVFPGTTKTADPKTGLRYIDSKELIGPIPDILSEALELVERHMSRAGVIGEDGLRREIPEYPIAAVREAIVNALQHRDYSPAGRGTHVQVNLYSDRLEVLSPEGVQSTRNEILSRLLSYTPCGEDCVVKNKGNGFFTIQASLDDLGMPPPKIESTLTFFRVTFEKRDVVGSKKNTERWENPAEGILAALSEGKDLSVAELVARSGLSRATVSKYVRELVEEGKIVPLERPRSPKQRYRRVH